MSYQNNLVERTREELDVISSRLEDQLSALQEQGLLTPLDKQKLITDARTSGIALLNALSHENYLPQMQEELIKRLVKQFENSTNDIIERAKLRKYFKPRLIERFSNIENRVLAQYGGLSDRDINKARNDFRRLESNYVARIELLISRGNVTEVSIEPLFDQFQDDAAAVVLASRPKLRAAEDKDRPIYTGRRGKSSTDSNIHFSPTREDFQKPDGHVTFRPTRDDSQDSDSGNVQKKTLTAERHTPWGPIAILAAAAILCLLSMFFLRPLIVFMRLFIR